MARTGGRGAVDPGAGRCVISGCGGIAICNQCVAVCADGFERSGVPLPPTVTLEQQPARGRRGAAARVVRPARVVQTVEQRTRNSAATTADLR
jgi:hypothetical protein